MKKETFLAYGFIALLSMLLFSCNKSATLDSDMLNKVNNAEAREELIRFEEALTSMQTEKIMIVSQAVHWHLQNALKN